MLKNMIVQPPIAPAKPKEMTEHGHTRIDPYYWLNERDNPEVIAYLNAENAYREEVMADLKDLQEELFQEIKGRIKEKDESVPQFNNGYWYYHRFVEGGEYPIHCRKATTLDAPEQIMIDVNELAKPFDYYHATSLTVSPDNRILAYAEDTVSRRIYTIVFKDLETGKLLSDSIPNTDGSFVWANDNQTLFYGIKDETLRCFKIMKHRLGTDASTDSVVFHEEDPTFNLDIGKTKSRKYLLIASSQTICDEYRYLDADTPDGEWQVFLPRERKLEYSLDHGDQWYIRTNLNALNFRLMSAKEGSTDKAEWQEVIAHRPDVYLENFTLFKSHLVLEERINGIVNIRIKSWDGSQDGYVDFGEDSYVAHAANNPEFGSPNLRLAYTSLTTPSSVFEVNLASKGKTLLKQQEVLGGFDRNNYVSERIYATARDGVKVPISIVYRKGYKKNGTEPILLYAYGSYGYSIDPNFSAARLSLLDRGFAYAIAHIRGGQEMGRHWYEDGKLLKKQNTFNDFVDCGDYLVAQHYTSPDHLFAMGGSAGGLLMGAVVNMRPDLFKGVVAAVPFVDVVTTMLDETIPLTTFEWDEWGNPKDLEFYKYMLSYSPYDQVERKDYPAMLVTTGLHDSQVQYFEPAKWVAKLRTMKTDKNPLLMHTNMDAGHGGQSGRFRAFKEVAMEYAFMLDLAGKAVLRDEE
ncbi:MAG: prolyl oligopeptidase family serine peptidase [Bacteroidetes bacterium]|nr:prolyl oligopeptidase family serine peptidase [Bacteroidota bacterium]